MYVWNICNFCHSKCHLEHFFLITYINYYNLHRHNYSTLNLYRSMYDTGRWLYLTVKTFHCVSLFDIWQCKKIWVSQLIWSMTGNLSFYCLEIDNCSFDYREGLQKAESIQHNSQANGQSSCPCRHTGEK